MGAFATAANAQIKCSKVEVGPIRVEAKVERNVVADAGPKIELVPSKTAGEVLTLVAYGPILGSMDSPAVNTQLLCTEAGVRLVATISRSEHYTGAALQNQLWRPQIGIMVTLRSSEVGIESIWQMQLTNGKKVARARTHPYPGQVYPVKVSLTLHAPSGTKN